MAASTADAVWRRADAAPARPACAARRLLLLAAGGGPRRRAGRLRLARPLAQPRHARPVPTRSAPAGAYTADLLYQIFGLAAWLPVVVGLAWGLRLASSASSPGPGCRSWPCRWRCWRRPPSSPACRDAAMRSGRSAAGSAGSSATCCGAGSSRRWASPPSCWLASPWRCCWACRRWACAGARASGSPAGSPPARCGSAARLGDVARVPATFGSGRLLRDGWRGSARPPRRRLIADGWRRPPSDEVRPGVVAPEELRRPWRSIPTPSRPAPGACAPAAHGREEPASGGCRSSPRAAPAAARRRAATAPAAAGPVALAGDAARAAPSRPDTGSSCRPSTSSPRSRPTPQPASRRSRWPRSRASSRPCSTISACAARSSTPSPGRW